MTAHPPPPVLPSLSDTDVNKASNRIRADSRSCTALTHKAVGAGLVCEHGGQAKGRLEGKMDFPSPKQQI